MKPSAKDETKLGVKAKDEARHRELGAEARTKPGAEAKAKAMHKELGGKKISKN